MPKYRVTDDKSINRVEVHTFSPFKSTSSGCLGCLMCLAWVVAIVFMALFIFVQARPKTRYAFVPVQWIYHDGGGLPATTNQAIVGDELVASQLFPPFLLQPLSPTVKQSATNNVNKHIHRGVPLHNNDCMPSSYSPLKKRSAENVSVNEVLYRHEPVTELDPRLGLIRLKLLDDKTTKLNGRNFGTSTRRTEGGAETRKSREMKETESSTMNGATTVGVVGGLNEFQAQLLSFIRNRKSGESQNETLDLLKNKFQNELTGIMKLLASNRIKFSSTSPVNTTTQAHSQLIGSTTNYGSSTLSADLTSQANPHIIGTSTKCCSSSDPVRNSSEKNRSETTQTQRLVEKRETKPVWSFLLAEYKVTFLPGPSHPSYSTPKITKKIPPWLNH